LTGIVCLFKLSDIVYLAKLARLLLAEWVSITLLSVGAWISENELALENIAGQSVSKFSSNLLSC
jgi:hypothetical protein